MNSAHRKNINLKQIYTIRTIVRVRYGNKATHNKSFFLHSLILYLVGLKELGRDAVIGNRSGHEVP
jgi:hypothetical protein